MNNIYKVIWSKAKNCYVVASEIAKSHTKSASGSEKMGGYGKRALLALAAASAIFCGGLVNVGAVDTVHVDESSTPAAAQEVYTKAAVDTALDKKADKDSVYTKADTYTKTEVNNAVDKKADKDSVYTKADTYTKTEVNAKLAKKADASNVFTKDQTFTKDQVNLKLADYAKTTDVNTALAGKANAADVYTKTDVDGKLANKADKTYVDTEVGKKADKATTLAGYGITDAYTKGDVDTRLNEKADKTALTQATDRITANEATIAGLTTKTTKITYDAALGTNVDGVTFNAGAVTGVTSINGTEIGTKESGEYIHQDNSIWGNMKKVDTQVKTNADDIKTNKNAITALDTKVGTVGTGTYLDSIKSVGENLGLLDAGLKQEVADRTAADTALSDRIGTVTDDGEYIKKSATNNVSDNLKVLDARAKVNADAIAQETADRKAAIGQLAVNGNYIEKDKNVSDNLVNLDNQAKANADAIVETDKRTGGITRNLEKTQTTIEGKVTVDNSGNVGGVKNLSAETINTTGNATIGGDLKVAGTITTDKMIFGDKATNNYTEIDHGKVTSKNLVVNGAGETISSSSTFNAEEHKVGFANSATGDQSFHKQTSDIIMDNVKDRENSNNRTQTKTETKDIITDKDGNSSTTSQTASENKTYLKDKDGKNTNSTVDTAKGYDKTIKGENGETSTKQDELNITNTAQNGTITNDAQNIVNNASGNISNKSQTMDTTVTGKATESYGELETTVNGKETHNVTGSQDIHVTGKQTNTVESGQENIISGGQTNTITGGQINNITGDQTTTITGNKTETVTENVTEDYKKNLTTTVGGNEIHEVKGTKTETVEGKLTENFNGGQETTVTGDKKTTVTGKTTEEYKGGLETTVTGDEKHTVTGNQTTNVTGDISNTAENITNEANTKLTDKVGDHTRVLDGDGITDTVGGSTFKQRIDKIMMESKDVSIKAEETLTNEAKVITNKASEVINNEAININNTATGIITSKASEIKNQADKLISNKVGENTWENMEDGKITTSIKDGTKQNLTQSDAAGTTQSTVDGAKSTVTIQNADGLTGAVTDGRNTSVQNQTASAIATDVKDGAGNENASVANATTSANTITNGTKANTVISTAGGTTFNNSKANTAFEGGTYTDTTIKGNTITTGKVTMDYADVMKDLGVYGNATVAKDMTVKGNTTLGEAGKDTTLTVNSKATFNNGLTVTNGETKLKNTTIEGTLNVLDNATFKKDVTANSFSVNGKTYIDSDGLNANNQVIRNVADGSISEGSKDAVNGGQLYQVKNDLEGKVNKVGANAAAMANLHPMEFDPDSKWNIAAAMGNYGSETATAIGAFYRPNEDVMVNFSTAFGTGENMVGGGISVRLGKGSNKLSREESNALKAQVNDLTARMDALLSVLNPNMSKDFPDVPENHWAYEAVSRLAGNDIVQGYPDGEFHGDRTMTRYEMAEIIYNALSRGAEAEKELVEEFKPELQAMAASEKATAERAEG